MSDHLTVSEFAKEVRVTPRSVHNWRIEGRILAVKLPNGRYLIPKSELTRIMEVGNGEIVTAPIPDRPRES